MDEQALKSTSDDAGRLERLLDELSTNQKRFIIARQEHTTDKDAALSIGLSPDTVKNWKYSGTPIDEVVDLMAHDGVVMALHLRRKALAKAMAVKVAGLDSEDEGQRQKVSTEIIEWEMGKATQRQEVSGPDGGPIETKLDGPGYNQTISSFADAVGEILSRPDSEQGGVVDAEEQTAVAGASEPGG